MKRSRQDVSLARGLRRKQTDAEKALWAKLRNRQLEGVKFRRQQLVGSYVVDLVSFETKLVIEVDGGQHNEDSVRARDDERTARLRERGYQVIGFWDNEFLTNLEGVLEAIRKALL